MALKIFIYGFFSVGLFFLFYSFDNSSYEIKKSDEAKITFKNATLYSLDTQGLKSVFIAKEAYKYDDRNEFKNASYTAKYRTNTNIVDTLLADKIIHKDDKVFCTDNVKINRSSFLLLSTNKLEYDTKTKFLSINDKFYGSYYAHTLSGNALFVDNNTKMVAMQPHFEIEVSN